MTRTLIAAAAATIAFAAPAFGAERSFTHDGVTYHYTVSPKGEARVLEGKASTGSTFRLTVRDGWVNGYVANARVSFRAPKVGETAQVLAAR